MDIFVNFVVFLLSVISVESAVHIKSIKLSKNVIYDCMDIYKQPSLSHPLLKHHNLQMKPTGWDSRPESKFVERGHKNKIDCPDGTVPILRIKRENVTQSQQYSINQFSVLTAKYPGTHIAGMKIEERSFARGIEAGMRTYNLSIGKDQSTSAQAYVAASTTQDANSIQAGWMINEKLFGDKRPWSYGIWLGDHGTGCFNVRCPGFVQVAKKDPINEPLDAGGNYLHRISIHQDKKTKNWWLTKINQDDTSRIDVGYWPNELFSLLGVGADFIGFGGIVTSDPRGPSPPMGNGRLPYKDDFHLSGSLEHLIKIIDDYTGAGFGYAEPMVDSKNCYDIHYVGYVDQKFGIVVTYGGPGGIKCGD